MQQAMVSLAVFLQTIPIIAAIAAWKIYESLSKLRFCTSLYNTFFTKNLQNLKVRNNSAFKIVSHKGNFAIFKQDLPQY